MKFNWGTGIVIFMTLFMAAIISFVVFAWHQDVNLVYRNYYEKGVDYSARMDADRRSAAYAGKISVENLSDSVRILFPLSMVSIIDSGKVLFFRPSDHNKDIRFPLLIRDSTFTTSKSKLIHGRYIVKITWVTAGDEYEVDKTFIVE